jgi:hypothetical protein
MVASTHGYEGEYAFRHCVVASTWAFEAQGPGSIPGGGAILLPADRASGATMRSAPVRLTT